MKQISETAAEDRNQAAENCDQAAENRDQDAENHNQAAENHTPAAERHELAAGRIAQIGGEKTAAEPYRDYFIRTAAFILQIEELYEKQRSGELREMTLSELQALNQALYEDILPGHYEESYANPSYAVRLLGEGYGRLLSFLCAEIRGMIVYAFEGRLSDITILQELFIEIYNLFEEGEAKEEEVKEVLYYFVSDYCDVTLPGRIRETLDPACDFARSIIMDSDLTDLRYLYRFGEYISDTELSMAAYLNGLPEATVRKMADTFTGGYQKGFEATGRDYRKKKTVQIRCPLGFERMIRMAAENFKAMGLTAVISRAAVDTMNRTAAKNNGYCGTPANRQYDYDHRYDNALYLDKALKERKLSVLRLAYEQNKELAAGYAGPAVVQTFGETAFNPVNKKEAFSLDEKQEKLLNSYANEAMEIVDEYIPGSETSFTIIAFPVPEIGPDFKEIFDETIRINTLDYEVYKKLQQTLIDELDQAEYVTVTGKGSNPTRMKVMLHKLTDPAKETKFENCVADVNIPVGEVFTSPRLTGTEGILSVGAVYIGGFCFKNLTLRFKDGRVTDYTCDNFSEPEQCRALVKQVIFKNHDDLPLGEFAIGTNTTAYAAAQKYGILDKFPILIAEKMGPHFAVGDTCYSWSEDCRVYNPDGKEIVAKDNEISVLRKEDPQKAYFSCHTDITLPYSELDTVTAVRPDGTGTQLIRDGRFVLAGTEALNEPLDEM